MNHYNSSYSLIDKNGLRKYLNQTERDLFFEQLKNSSPKRKLFCLMLFWSGARISEVLNLKVENIDFSDSFVVIESLKKRRKGVFRQVPIPPKYLSHLKLYLANRNSEEKIWEFSRRTATRHIKSIMNEAAIKGPQACAKGLRHSFAIHCLMKKIPITLIKKWLGHSSLATTSIYLNVANEEEKKIASLIW